MTITTNPLDFPALDGRGVTEAHVKVCAARGHAHHSVDAVDTGICPRCGEVTEANPYARRIHDPMPGGYDSRSRWVDHEHEYDDATGEPCVCPVASCYFNREAG